MGCVVYIFYIYNVLQTKNSRLHLVARWAYLNILECFITIKISWFLWLNETVKCSWRCGERLSILYRETDALFSRHVCTSAAMPTNIRKKSVTTLPNFLLTYLNSFLMQNIWTYVVLLVYICGTQKEQ